MACRDVVKRKEELFQIQNALRYLKMSPCHWKNIQDFADVGLGSESLFTVKINLFLRRKWAHQEGFSKATE